MMAFEVAKEYPGSKFVYHDLNKDESAVPAAIAREVEEKNLFWPVFVADEHIIYDGMASLNQMIDMVAGEKSRRERLAAAANSDWTPSA